VDRGPEQPRAAEAHVLPALLRNPNRGRQHQHAQQNRLLHSSFCPFLFLRNPAPQLEGDANRIATKTGSVTPNIVPVDARPVQRPATQKGRRVVRLSGPSVESWPQLLCRCRWRRWRWCSAAAAWSASLWHRIVLGRLVSGQKRLDRGVLVRADRHHLGTCSRHVFPGAANVGDLLGIRVQNRLDLGLLVGRQSQSGGQLASWASGVIMPRPPPPPPGAPPPGAPPCAIIGVAHSAALHNATAPTRMAYLRIIIFIGCSPVSLPA